MVLKRKSIKPPKKKKSKLKDNRKKKRHEDIKETSYGVARGSMNTTTLLLVR